MIISLGSSMVAIYSNVRKIGNFYWIRIELEACVSSISLWQFKIIERSFFFNFFIMPIFTVLMKCQMLYRRMVYKVHMTRTIVINEHKIFNFMNRILKRIFMYVVFLTDVISKFELSATGGQNLMYLEK